MKGPPQPKSSLSPGSSVSPEYVARLEVENRLLREQLEWAVAWIEVGDVDGVMARPENAWKLEAKLERAREILRVKPISSAEVKSRKIRISN